MPQLHLPAKHSHRDLELAGTLASILQSRDLYVAWSVEAGPAEPLVAAAIAEVEPRRTWRERIRALLARRG